MSDIPNASGEQQKIIDAVSRGESVIVDAVPGSGKTTTSLLLAIQCPTKSFILVTYNRQLAEDTKKKVNIPNIKIYTIHGLATAFYSRNKPIYNDDKLKDLLLSNVIIKKEPPIDVFIMDEAQDMTIDLYQLCRKFVRDIERKIQLVILGDRYQAVYEFRGSDKRCVSLAHMLWRDYCDNFNHLTLRTSYRLTKPMANFVNSVILGSKKIVAIKDGSPVKYYCINVFAGRYKDSELNENIIPKSIKNVVKKIHTGNINPDDVFVLSYSMNNPYSPARICEEYFSNNGISCYVSKNDIEDIDPYVMRKKVVFTTFCSAKGRERKIVILYDFDSFYTSKVFTPRNPTECPPNMFVGLTRPSEKLIIIHHYKNDLPSFIRLSFETISNLPYIKVRGVTRTEHKVLDDFPQSSTSVTAFIRHLKLQTTTKLVKLIETLFIEKEPPTSNIQLCSTIDGKATGTLEDVSSINGLAIPFMFERELKGSATICDYLQKDALHLDTLCALYKKAYKRTNIYPETIIEYLRATTLYYSIQNGYTHTLNQIDRYDWLDQNNIDSCKKILYKYIGIESEFEININVYTKYESRDILIGGRIDVCNKENIYELKCVNALSLENHLQLCVYAWMISESEWNNFQSLKYYLLNFRTGELKEMRFDKSILQSIIDTILEDKYTTKTIENDVSFVNRFNTLRLESNDHSNSADTTPQIEYEEIERSTKRLARKIK